MEHFARNFVDACVELVYTSGDECTNETPDHLTPELGSGSGAEEMAGFEILHHVTGLEGAAFADGTGEEVYGDGVGVAGGDDEGEEELGEF